MKFTNLEFVSINGVDITDSVSSVDIVSNQLEVDMNGFAVSEHAVTFTRTFTCDQNLRDILEAIYGMPMEEYLNMFWSPSSLHESGWVK